jgi:hypothetical protein
MPAMPRAWRVLRIVNMCCSTTSQLRQPARGGCKSGCALQGKQRKQTIISPGTLVRTWGTQRFAYYRGAAEGVCAMHGMLVKLS